MHTRLIRRDAFWIVESDNNQACGGHSQIVPNLRSLAVYPRYNRSHNEADQEQCVDRRDMQFRRKVNRLRIKLVAVIGHHFILPSARHPQPIQAAFS